MNVRMVFVFLFWAYGLLVLLFGGSLFSPEMWPSVLCVSGISLVMGAILYTKRCFALNFMLAVYVGTKYLLLPWVPFLYQFLDGNQLLHMYAVMNYYEEKSSARIFLFVLMCLTGWLLGLLTFAPKRPDTPDRRPLRLPAFFRQIDALISGSSAGFWITVFLLMTLTTRHLIVGGIGGTAKSEETEGALLFGLLTTDFVVLASLFTYVFASVTGAKRPNRWLLLLPVLSALVSLFAGARAALYIFVLLSMFYAVALCEHRLRLSGKAILLILVLVPAVFFAGVMAGELRPLWRNEIDPSVIVRFAFESIENGRIADKFIFTICVLIARLADVLGQFYIISDRFIYDPWLYLNPLQIMMRTINDLVPGELFPGILTINQLFDWVYYGELTTYNSEFWGAVGISYIYFGYYLTPFVFLGLGFLISRFVYYRVLPLIRTSPSFAAFVIVICWDTMEFGTLERIVVKDGVRVLISGLIILGIARILNIAFQSVVANLRRHSEQVQSR